MARRLAYPSLRSARRYAALVTTSITLGWLLALAVTI
jgi:hypothetical protein